MSFFKVVRKVGNKLFSSFPGLPEKMELEYIPGVETFPIEELPRIFAFKNYKSALSYACSDDDEIWRCHGELCEEQNIPRVLVWHIRELPKVNYKIENLECSRLIKNYNGTVYLKSCTLLERMEVETPL
jgi:hypothetical protein